ncbi:uncharacterized protein LOC120446667 [Drosophila santomea]|uniref:uncharacterized protein LOC120446667 n=1 Tax=Drosophila santomea TaxID=129105 RepID=UPI00195387B6|nr:uncharacterized protein LOC120446667 [Drosophila santomea]XP_039483673.1 uncharacterized protein LOC120446667 [Drosophila santomea]
MNYLLILGCAILMMRPMYGDCLRMKRSRGDTASDYNETTATDNGASLSGKATVLTNSSITTANMFAATSPKQKNATGPVRTTVVRGKTSTSSTTTTALSSSLAAVASTSTSSPPDAGKFQLVDDPMGLRRPKRRLGSLMDDSLQPRQLRHKRRQAGEAAVVATPLPPNLHPNPSPSPNPNPNLNPYVYYNKMVSPDGKHEVKEFELLSPNMMIESVQQELNYGPEVLPPELAEVLLLNAAENTPRGLHNAAPLKHHRKHKSSPALPPMLYMLQQLLQPPFEGNLLVEPPKEPQRRVSSPLYQFLDGAMDLALRNSPDVIDHLLGDHLELEMERMQGLKDKALAKKAKKGAQKLEPKEELIVSCPIHHEHHANRNGDVVEDDVVLVNECHLV